MSTLIAAASSFALIYQHVISRSLALRNVRRYTGRCVFSNYWYWLSELHSIFEYSVTEYRGWGIPRGSRPCGSFSPSICVKNHILTKTIVIVSSQYFICLVYGQYFICLFIVSISFLWRGERGKRTWHKSCPLSVKARSCRLFFCGQVTRIITSTKTASKESEQTDLAVDVSRFATWSIIFSLRRCRAYRGGGLPLSLEGSLNTSPASLLPSSQSECFALITTLRCRKTSGKLATLQRQACRKMSAGGEITPESDASQSRKKEEAKRLELPFLSILSRHSDQNTREKGKRLWREL